MARGFNGKGGSGGSRNVWTREPSLLMWSVITQYAKKNTHTPHDSGDINDA